MTFKKVKKGKIRELIAITSALVITISNTFPVSLAKETNEIGTETLSGGVLAEPYIPENAKLDEEGNPVLDEEGRFILLDEEGNELSNEELKKYEMTWDEETPIVYDFRIDDRLSEKLASSRAAQMKVVNLNNKNVNIRSSAVIKDGNVVGKIKSGGFADIVGESGSWWKVKSGSTIGYVTKGMVYQLGTDSSAVVKSITGVNIRSGSGTNHSKIGYMPEGVTAEAVDISGNWFKVIYQGTIGWVCRDYVKYVNSNLGKSITITAGSLSSNTYFKDNARNYKHQTSTYIKDASGRHVYCVDSEKQSPNGHPFSRSNQANDVIYRLLKNGYPYKSFTGDSTVDRVITQAALWSYVDKENVSINNLVAVKNGSTNTEMLNYAKQLYNNALNGTQTQEVSIRFSNTALNAKLKGDNFETDYMTMVGSGDIKASKITLAAYNVDNGMQNTNVKIKDENNKDLTQVAVNQKFKIVIPKSLIKGKIKLQAKGDLTHDIAVEYSSNLSAIQNAVVLEEAIESKMSTNELVVDWNGAGKIKITKVDSSNKQALAGAVFVVKNESGTQVAKLTTDSKGEAVTGDLLIGKYTVQEVTSPTGYVLNSKEYTVEIKDTSTQSITVTNDKIVGSIKILKKDEKTGALLEGAEFTLYDANGNVVKKATSDKNGEVKFTGIPYGSYVLKETVAPKDYVKIDTSMNIVINKNGQVVEGEVLNRKAGGVLDFQKVDVATGAIVEGAKIQIRGIEEKNKDIKFEFESKLSGNRFELPVGKYEITETIAPLGYVLSKETQTFEIKENGQVIKAKLTNKFITGNIKIVKIDGDETDKVKYLPGAEFELARMDGTVITKGVTDKNGILVFSNVPFGEYLIVESNPPADYIASDIKEKVIINEDGKTIELVVKNSKAMGELEFNKIDELTGKLVAGATMKIKGNEEKNKNIEIEFVSNNEGSQKFKLPLGKYLLTEQKSPEGYVLNEKPVEFEITKHGQIVSIEFMNKPIRGSVEIIKVDAEDKEKVLQGAEFKLYDKEGNEVGVAVTDEAGVVRFENLPYGKYFAKEHVAPQGYVLTDSIIEIDIAKDGEKVSVMFPNSKSIGEVDFSKVDVSTGDVIEGAEIEILGISELNKDIKVKFISSKEGNRFKLPVGVYQFSETLPPEGYVLSTEVGTFEIKENGEIVKAKLENRPIVGDIEITKVDADTREVLQGAEFALLDSESQEIAKGIVDEKGKLTFKDLKYGQYKIKELTPPAGYVLSEEVKNVKVEKDGHTVEVVIENTKEPVIMKGSIEITKVDANKKDLVLQGAEFKLYNDKDKELAIGVTDKQGKLVFKDLDLGVYFIKETKAPQSYQINEKATKVTVDENGVVVKVTITNAQKLAQTGGNFSSTNMIFIGIGLVGAAIILSNKERRTLK